MINAARSPDVLRVRLHRAAPALQGDGRPATRSRWSIYHSHTATEAYPSRTDIGLAMEPDAHYVLVAPASTGIDEGPVEFRSYRIVDGEVTEEEVEVVASLPNATERVEH